MLERLTQGKVESDTSAEDTHSGRATEARGPRERSRNPFYAEETSGRIQPDRVGTLGRFYVLSSDTPGVDAKDKNDEQKIALRLLDHS